MDFPQEYQLIELLPGEGVQSYRARQTNTGRDVTVHLLVGGKTPENEAFLVRLRGMQPQPMGKLIEVGEYQGAAFVVTVAPPYQRLDEWLAEQDRAAVVKDFGKAGFWKRPEAGSQAPPPILSLLFHKRLQNQRGGHLVDDAAVVLAGVAGLVENLVRLM